MCRWTFGIPWIIKTDTIWSWAVSDGRLNIKKGFTTWYSLIIYWDNDYDTDVWNIEMTQQAFQLWKQLKRCRLTLLTWVTLKVLAYERVWWKIDWAKSWPICPSNATCIFNFLVSYISVWCKFDRAQTWPIYPSTAISIFYFI